MLASSPSLSGELTIAQPLPMLSPVEEMLTPMIEETLTPMVEETPVEDPPEYSLVSRQCGKHCSGRIYPSNHPYHPIVVWDRYKVCPVVANV